MRTALARLLDSPRTVYAASAITLGLGLFFVFIWAPHPWGWRGIDQYHELARALARGEPFGTTDVPWGYAYYVAAFYAVFGEQAWIPVTVQAIINASAPLLLYYLVRPLVSGHSDRTLAGRRTATLAALLVGVFSFNTIYASTQASDAICTVLFLASLLCFVRGYQAASLGLFAMSGLLSGLVPQFRPNMILFPFVLAGAYAILPWPGRPPRRLAHAAVFIAFVALALTPWVARNYRLTGQFLPTSTHGGVQLWYGSLQVGPYLEGRAYNPRSIFETPAFDYTSLAGPSIVISADTRSCAPWDEAVVELIYWTDRAPGRQRVLPRDERGQTLVFELPGQPAPTAIYYYFEANWKDTATGEALRQSTPFAGAGDPLIYFVADSHLRDLDLHGDLLDVFDVGRVMRHLAWDETLPDANRLDGDGDGHVAEPDLERAVARLLPANASPDGGSPFGSLEHGPDHAVLRLSDGSSLTMPRDYSGLVTDLGVEGNLAGALSYARRSFASLSAAKPVRGFDACRLLEHVRTNDVFYRKEPHRMARYMALALDNIRREPVAFAAASAYRMVRLFIIRGTDDVWTAQQFTWSRLVYGAGTVLSASYFLVFLAGVVIAWRRRSPLLFFLLPIVYVPVTICFVLTNMRYTITVQPLMFAFVAVAIIAALGLDSGSEDVRATETQRH